MILFGLGKVKADGADFDAALRRGAGRGDAAGACARGLAEKDSTDARSMSRYCRLVPIARERADARYPIRSRRCRHDGARRGARPAAPVRHRQGVRQSRLDRVADVSRFPGRSRLRARVAGGGGGRDGRRLCAGERPGGAGQPAFGRRARQRDGQPVHGLSQPHAADRHGGAAGALAAAARSLSRRAARGRAAAALCEMERRASPRAGCARRDRTRLADRDAGAARAGVRVGAGGRLGPAGRAGGAARGEPGAGA